jgi:dolichyl-phosphate beta-glucosyltransferase
MKNIYLSVVIPAYNEECNLRSGVLDSVSSYLNRQKYSWEVLIVDDGSTDRTVSLAEGFAKKHLGFRVFKEPHRGKGRTLVAGTLLAKGEFVLFMDMDQATPTSEVGKFLPKLEKDYDVVIGSRSGRKGAPLIRKLMAYGFALLRNIILRLPFKDTQCGFKVFRRESAREIFKRLQVFNKENTNSGASVTAGFDLEVLYVARKLGLKIAEVGVTWHHQHTERINPIKDSWEGLRELLLVRIKALQNKYGL